MCQLLPRSEIVIYPTGDCGGSQTDSPKYSRRIPEHGAARAQHGDGLLDARRKAFRAHQEF